MTHCILRDTYRTILIIEQTHEFSEWLHGLKDIRAKQKIAVRIRRLSFGNFGDVKPVGEAVSELRIHYDAGYRVYFTKKDNTIVIILCGGNKKTQNKDIKKAKELSKEI